MALVLFCWCFLLQAAVGLQVVVRLISGLEFVRDAIELCSCLSSDSDVFSA